MLLACHQKGHIFSILAIPLVMIGSGRYCRASAPLKLVNHNTWHRWPLRRLQLLMTGPNAFQRQQSEELMWIEVSPDVRLLNVYPSHMWIRARSTIQWSQHKTKRDSNFCALMVQSRNGRDTFAVLGSREEEPLQSGTQWWTAPRFTHSVVPSAQLSYLRELFDVLQFTTVDVTRTHHPGNIRVNITENKILGSSRTTSTLTSTTRESAMDGHDYLDCNTY
ncbi:hypothetical protein BX600DRAFT_320116 [Xylariales sp. PMI_506]|nr:hypothetical protein BX600DRAFT_320116 [Xylariales sp. PMI_506]